MGVGICEGLRFDMKFIENNSVIGCTANVIDVKMGQIIVYLLEISARCTTVTKKYLPLKSLS